MTTKLDNQTVLDDIVRHALFQDERPMYLDTVMFVTPDGNMSPIGAIFVEMGVWADDMNDLNDDDDKVKQLLEDAGYDYEFVLAVDRIICANDTSEGWLTDLKEVADKYGVEVNSE